MLQTIVTAFERSGLSIKALADQSQLPYAAVYNAVHGKSDPQLSTVAKMAGVLGLELRPTTRATA